MWKPTNTGAYLYNGNAIFVFADYVVPTDGTIMITKVDGVKYAQSLNGPWSLLSPDWQEGAPTAEQLEQWRHWCIDFGCGSWACEVESTESNDHLFAFGANVDRATVKRSAPIQPDGNNGPLWVPLEVCK